LTTEIARLLDIVHADQKLYLVFEFLDVDLKRYMEAGNSQGEPITLELCQVMIFISLLSFTLVPFSPTSPCLYANNASTFAPNMSARSALARHRCLASTCQRFLVPKSKDSGNRFQLARVSRDSRAVSGTPNLDMPGPLGAYSPGSRWHCLAEFLFSFSFSPLPLAVLMVYFSLVVFVMVATRNRNLHTS
jgi:hypothetical protein